MGRRGFIGMLCAVVAGLFSAKVVASVPRKNGEIEAPQIEAPQWWIHEQIQKLARSLGGCVGAQGKPDGFLAFIETGNGRYCFFVKDNFLDCTLDLGNGYGGEMKSGKCTVETWNQIVVAIERHESNSRWGLPGMLYGIPV